MSGSVTGSRLAETLAVGAAGALLGGVTGNLVGWRTAGAAIGAANGLIGGWRRVYRWRDPAGVAQFAADSTWALASTAAGVCSHAVAALSAVVGRPAGYSDALSRRQGRHVYAGGFRLRRGFLVTLGNVVSGAGDLTSERRVRVVTDHEQIHIAQARALGPAYPVVYGASTILGAAIGVMVGLGARIRGGQGDDAVGLMRVIETYAYYCNPCEWWAYSRDANWPPPGKVPGRGWSRPIVAPLTPGSDRGTRAGSR